MSKENFATLLEAETVEKLRTTAKEERRAMNAIIEIALENYFNKKQQDLS